LYECTVLYNNNIILPLAVKSSIVLTEFPKRSILFRCLCDILLLGLVQPEELSSGRNLGNDGIRRCQVFHTPKVELKICSFCLLAIFIATTRCYWLLLLTFFFFVPLLLAAGAIHDVASTKSLFCSSKNVALTFEILCL